VKGYFRTNRSRIATVRARMIMFWKHSGEIFINQPKQWQWIVESKNDSSHLHGNCSWLGHLIIRRINKYDNNESNHKSTVVKEFVRRLSAFVPLNQRMRIEGFPPNNEGGVPLTKMREDGGSNIGKSR
jgi:hypothetical protein